MPDVCAVNPRPVDQACKHDEQCYPADICPGFELADNGRNDQYAFVTTLKRVIKPLNNYAIS
jgi:hypothetical protein